MKHNLKERRIITDLIYKNIYDINVNETSNPPPLPSGLPARAPDRSIDKLAAPFLYLIVSLFQQLPSPNLLKGAPFHPLLQSARQHPEPS